MAAAQRTDHALERLVFFSDAVFAIAITLLIIEVHVPDVPRGAPDAAYWSALAHLWPSFLGYGLSFAVIGSFWLGHHRAFTLARRHHPGVIGWNMALLATIAFLPFVTAFYSRYSYARPAIALYCGALLVAAIFNMIVVRTATGPKMVAKEADPEAVTYVRRRSVSVALGAATALLLACIAPRPLWGQLGLISIPIWRRILAGRRVKGV
ncbi:MAG TPA: TMEM175 family protein [Allosphingosinicella sp.]|nr:TMEM175 family protein [Allosphingosinicella sp.]